MRYANRILSFLLAGTLMFTSMNMTAFATDNSEATVLDLVTQTQVTTETVSEIAPAQTPTTETPTTEPSQPEPTPSADAGETPAEQPATDVDPSKETVNPDGQPSEEKPAEVNPADGQTDGEKTDGEKTDEEIAKEEAEKEKENKEKELAKEKEEEESEEETIKGYKSFENITTHYKLALESLEEKFPKTIIALSNKEKEISIPIDEWKPIDNYDSKLGKYTFQPVFTTQTKIEDGVTMPILTVIVEDESDGPTGLIDRKVRQVPSAKKPESAKRLLRSSAQESFYNAYESGNYLPDVRNQGSEEACWAFAAIGSVETDLIKQSLAGKSLDLSELQLAYFTAHTVVDPKGCRPNDTVSYNGQGTYLNNGGHDGMAGQAFLNGIGPVEEKYVPYSKGAGYDPDASFAMGNNFARVNNIYEININDKDLIKQAIKEHGAVSAAINATETADVHYSSTYNSFYGKINSRNHAIMLVGWDDDFPADHFYEGCRPEGNGAWLVRNSWGLDDYGKHGYFWISYEDVSLINGNYVVAYSASTTCYDNVYSYASGEDGMSIRSYYTNGAQLTYNVEYDVKAGETIKAVAVQSNNVNASVNVTVTAGNNSSSGAKDIVTAGTYTIPIDNPITLSSDTTVKVSVCINPPADQPAYVIVESAPEGGIVSGSIRHYTHNDRGYTVGSSTSLITGDPYVRLYTDDTPGTPATPEQKLEIANTHIYDYAGTQYNITLTNDSVTTNPADIAWSVIDDNIATVTPAGTITIGNKKGSTVVQGTYTNGNKTFKVSLSVTVRPYNITYSLEDGVKVRKKYLTYYPGDSTNCVLPKTGDMAKPGYELNGWKNSLNETITQDTLLTRTGDVDLTPVWEAKTLAVKYYVLNEDGTSYSTTKKNIANINIEDTPYALPDAGGSINNPNDYAPDGKTFEGWSMDTAGVTEIETIEADVFEPIKNAYYGTYSFSEEIVLYPQYKLDGTYKITFDANKGKLPEGVESVKHFAAGDTYGELPVPKRTDYMFKGWHLNSLEGNIVKAEDVITAQSDITLVAEWELVGEDYDDIEPDESVHMPQLLTDTDASYGDLVRMITTTQNAKIYYVISDGSGATLENPTTSSNRYTEPFPLLEEYAYEDKIKIKAIAYRDGVYSASTDTITFTMTKSTEDWGEVLDIDRAQWTDANAVPTGMWISPASMKDDTDAGENADGTLDYTGKPRTYKGLRVYNHKTLLVENRDYIIGYRNNVNAGDPTSAIPPAIVVTGRGKYSQVFDHYFTINKRKLVGPNPVSDSTNVYVKLNRQYEANGRPIKAAGISLFESDSMLNLGRRISPGFYTTACYDSYSSESNNTALTANPGKKYAVITMKGNYEGTLIEEYNVLDNASSITRNTTIAIRGTRKPWITEGVIPDVTITDKNTRAQLVQGTDYDVEITYYGNGSFGDAVSGRNYRTKTISGNTDIKLTSVGKYDFAFVGKGKYSGVISRTITVTGVRLAIQNMSATEQWTGSPIIPSYSVKYAGSEVAQSADGKTNYYVTYSDNTDIGKATMTIVGNNDCGWDATPIVRNFRITGEKLLPNGVEIANTNVTFKNDIYNLEDIGLTVSNKSGDKLTVNKDYEVCIYDRYIGKDSPKNINATANVGNKIVVVTGLKGYDGIIRKNFRINPYNIKLDPQERLTFRLSTASMQKSGARPTVTLQDKNGTYDLVEGKDYRMTLSGNRGITTTTNRPRVNIIGIGNYNQSITGEEFYVRKGNLEEAQLKLGAIIEGRLGKPQTMVYLGGKLTEGKNADYTARFFRKQSGVWQELKNSDIVKKGEKIMVVATGVKNYGGKIQKITEVIERNYNIAQASFAITDKLYTGEAVYIKSEDITRAVIAGTQLKYGTDYWIDEESYQNNINTGVARIALEGIGKYAGRKEVTFRIRPVYMNYSMSFTEDPKNTTGSYVIYNFGARVSPNRGGIFRLPRPVFVLKDSLGRNRTREYVFEGWYKADGTRVGQMDTMYNATGDINPGENLKLYARFEKAEEFEVSFDANKPADAKKVTGAMRTQKIKTGTYTRLYNNGYRADGYTFEGWAVSKADANASVPVVAFKNGEMVYDAFKDKTTLYAVWKKK